MSPSDQRMISRRRVLLAAAGVASAAIAGQLGRTGLASAAQGDGPGATNDGPMVPSVAATPDPAPSPRPVTDAPMLLGASIYEATLHGDESLVLPAVDGWRALTGFYPSVLPLWSPFDRELPAPRGGLFPADWLLEGLRGRGIEPAVFAHSAGQLRWPTHGYEAILRGERDEAIERWGQAAKAYGHRLILRWDHEMNGTFPWSRRSPEEYVRVFRHVSDRIRRVAGATNVELHFCPALRQRGRGLDGIESYYPGDDWCQVVGFDAYSRSRRWEPLAEQWASMLRRLERMTDRPVLVGEFGRRIDRADRDRWLASLAEVRGVLGSIYFDMNLTHFERPAHHWRMDGPMRAVYADLAEGRQ